MRKCTETVTGIGTILFTWNAKTTLIAWKDYFRETGQWYLGSAAIHALALILLGLISMSMPNIVISNGDVAPTFKSVETDTSPPPELAKFDLGEAPLVPTELNAETLAMFEAKPFKSQTAIHYDDDPEFVEAGGGSAANLNGPQLGGLGGLSVKNLPGPAGKGGVGVGSGLGDKAGIGGQGEGFALSWKRPSRSTSPEPEAHQGLGTRRGAALNWIARHQTSIGKWSLDVRPQCKNGVCSGPGTVRSDEAATAMALLPFFAAGQTHKTKSIYQQTISKGLAWLIQQQTPEGNLAPNSAQPMYAHGLATLALCEAYGMSRDAHVGAAARKAVAFIERAQHPAMGGWRYYPGVDSDTSVTGWQVMALKSAQLAGLAVNSYVFDNTQKWLHSVAKGEHLGLYSYQPYREVSLTMTAVGMLCTQYLGVDKKCAGHARRQAIPFRKSSRRQIECATPITGTMQRWPCIISADRNGTHGTAKCGGFSSKARPKKVVPWAVGIRWNQPWTFGAKKAAG